MKQFPLKQKRRLLPRPLRTETVDIHCHCRMPETKADRMILCNGTCQHWYHESCEIVQADIWNSRRRWFCRNCKKNRACTGAQDNGGTVEIVKKLLGLYLMHVELFLHACTYHHNYIIMGKNILTS